MVWHFAENLATLFTLHCRKVPDLSNVKPGQSHAAPPHRVRVTAAAARTPRHGTTQGAAMRAVSPFAGNFRAVPGRLLLPSPAPGCLFHGSIMFPLRSSGAGSCSCRSSTACLLSVSRAGYWRPPVAAAAGWRQAGAAPFGRQRRRGSQPPAAVPELLLATLEAASTVSETGMLAGSFEPRPPGPEIGIAAAFAATPPVLFWLRIARSQLKRQKEIDEAAAAEVLKEREREVTMCGGNHFACRATGGRL